MNFRLFTLIETDKFQFVRIHKNGNNSVIKCIQNNLKKGEQINYVYQLSKKPRFCIIRDPYERFLSGLKYDLWQNKVDIKDVDVSKLFVDNEHHLRNSWRGHIKHSTSQIPYIFNTQCTHYVDISDLNLFLKIHFNQTAHENKFNNIEKEYKNIEKHLNKNDIMKYLHLDYYVYNTLKTSAFMWDWQHGKIF